MGSEDGLRRPLSGLSLGVRAVEEGAERHSAWRRRAGGPEAWGGAGRGVRGAGGRAGAGQA